MGNGSLRAQVRGRRAVFLLVALENLFPCLFQLSGATYFLGSWSLPVFKAGKLVSLNRFCPSLLYLKDL